MTSSTLLADPPSNETIDVFYIKKVDTRDELLVNIQDVIACTKERQDALRLTTRHVLTQVAKCIDVDGGIFEHLLLTVQTFVT